MGRWLAQAMLCWFFFGTVVIPEQSDFENRVPIRIYWTATEPTLVLFEDPTQGEIRFSKQADRWEGIRPANGSWAFHDVVLSYDRQNYPLALRTWFDSAQITIRVARRGDTNCLPPDVEEIKAIASDEAPVADRIWAMLAARELLTLETNECERWGKMTLAQVYFNMNCSLAKQTEFFRVSQEAATYFIEMSGVADAAAQVAACENQMRGVAVNAIVERQNDALRRRDFTAFDGYNAELLELADREEWNAGFEVQRVSTTQLHADRLQSLYLRMRLSAESGDLTDAITWNQELLNLRDDASLNSAFGRVSLTRGRLEQDRDYLQSREVALRVKR